MRITVDATPGGGHTGPDAVKLAGRKAEPHFSSWYSPKAGSEPHNIHRTCPTSLILLAPHRGTPHDTPYPVPSSLPPTPCWAHTGASDNREATGASAWAHLAVICGALEARILLTLHILLTLPPP